MLHPQATHESYFYYCLSVFIHVYMFIHECMCMWVQVYAHAREGQQSKSFLTILRSLVFSFFL